MINIEKIKKYVIDQCENKLSYYDVVDEKSEMVDYQKIADFIMDLFMKNKTK